MLETLQPIYYLLGMVLMFSYLFTNLVREISKKTTISYLSGILISLFIVLGKIFIEPGNNFMHYLIIVFWVTVFFENTLRLIIYLKLQKTK